MTDETSRDIDDAPAGTSEGSEQPAEGSRKTSLVQRFLKAAILLILLAGVPVGAALALVGPQAASGAMLGSLAVFLVIVTGGWRRALWFLPALVVVSELSATLVGGWGWVALLAALGFAAGWAGRWGQLPPFVVMGVIASVVQPVDSLANYGWLAVSLFASGLYTLWLMRRVGFPKEVPVYRSHPAVSSLAAVLMALAVGGAAALALEWSAPRSFWIPMTTFLLILPSPGMTVRERSRERIVGTAVGVGLAVPVIALELPYGVDIALATLAILSSMAIPGPAWRAAAMTAFAIVLLMDGNSTTTDAAVSRLVATLGGALLAVAGVTLLALQARRRGLLDLDGVGDDLTSELVEGPDERARQV